MEKKKSLKGMTLIEVLIAVAILGIMTLFLAKNASIIERYNRSTTKLNQKVAVEGPLAETHSSNIVPELNDDGTIKKDSLGNTVYADTKIDDDVTINVGYCDDSGKLVGSAAVKGKAYTVESAYGGDVSGVAGGELDLKFINLD